MPWPAAVGSDRDAERAFVDIMSKAGIEVTTYDVTPPEHDTLRSRSMQETGIPLILAGWPQGYPDPQDYVSILLNSTVNIEGWHNAAFSRLVARADRELRAKTRATLYISAQKIAVREAALITGLMFIGTCLVHPWVNGVVFASTACNLGTSSF